MEGEHTGQKWEMERKKRECGSEGKKGKQLDREKDKGRGGSDWTEKVRVSLVFSLMSTFSPCCCRSRRLLPPAKHIALTL